MCCKVLSSQCFEKTTKATRVQWDSSLFVVSMLVSLLYYCEINLDASLGMLQNSCLELVSGSSDVDPY